jgi:hypothetical protein
VTDVPNLYQKCRTDVATMLGYDLDALLPEQALRLDVATSLRVLLDSQSGRLVRGESLDARELLMASEALSRLLPPLREPASAVNEPDPRQVMWQIYKQMRERGEIDLKSDEGWYQARIATLEAEIIALGGHPSAPEPGVSQHRVEAENRISGHLCGSITPTEVVPPSEWRGVPPMRGPDDPPRRPPPVLEGAAVPKSKPVPPQTWDETPGGKAWNEWRDAGGYGGGDRWANRNE